VVSVLTAVLVASSIVVEKSFFANSYAPMVFYCGLQVQYHFPANIKSGQQGENASAAINAIKIV
jgi:hypothetical protein